MFACRASTNGSQRYLVNAVFNNGGMVLDACRVEGYGGFEGRMKMAKVSGSGVVTLRGCGDRSALDISGNNITVNTA